MQRVEMRGGEGVGLTGYDGFVEASRTTPFVPAGLSVWEMGVGGDPGAKAQRDYRSRVDNPQGIDPTEHTFVFVTPRRWEEKKDWEQRKRAEAIWRDVRVLDADDIELALDASPAVQVWLSELLGLEPLGATSIEDWWGRYSRGFDPTMVPEVVLAGRADLAANLVRRIAEDVGRTFIRAVSVDDGLAFAACAMMAVPSEDAEPILARSLLVHDGVTLRRLDRTSSLLILLPYEDVLQREANLVENHHIVFVITDTSGDVDIELPPHDYMALQDALTDAGVPAENLDRYVRAGTKSLTALRRVATRYGQCDPEDWATDLTDLALRRAWLVGGWSYSRSGDVEVLADMCDIAMDELDERLQRAVHRADPVFTRVGSTWVVTSPKDSWRTARGLITQSDLEALERSVQTVLGSVDPRLELPAEDRWAAALHGHAPVHSSNLRKGLSRSLALLGARGDEARLAGGRSAREWAERIALNLFTRANKDKTTELWASIADVLPLLAEAAPDAFLRAISATTTGADPLARRLFQDTDDRWNVSSPHSDFLWAIEAVAWSEQHMAYAAEVLARLTEIDPGGRLSNRPSTSLYAIFRAWSPQTSATIGARIQTLRSLTHRHPDASWDLMLALLPSGHEVGMQSHAPEFRDWVAEATPATSADLLATLEAAASHVLRFAQDEATRWEQIVPKFDRLPPDAQSEAVEAISALTADQLEPDQRNALWDALNRYIRHHRECADAEWSLSEERLGRLATAADHLKPTKPADAHRWLFDDWHPDIGVPVDDLEGYDAELASRREEAIREVFANQGLVGVHRLAASVKLPWAAGSALAATTEVVDAEVIGDLDSDDHATRQFADGFARRRLLGSLNAIHRWAAAFDDRPRLQSRLLQFAEDLPAAWGALNAYDEAVRNTYWSEFSPYGRGADFPHVNEAVQNLLKHGRSAIAIDALSLYVGRSSNDIDENLVIQALEEFDSHDDPEARSVSAYDITRLLDYLKERGIDERRIALLEWKYLPVLQYDGEMPALQRLLSRDPRMFVQMIEMIFRPASARNDESIEQSAGDATLATNAYRLLREWKVVPGTNDDGLVNADALRAWLDEARQLLVVADRLEIGELQIGEVLAHSPEDADGTFPSFPIREILEAEQNERLVRGFSIGVFNKRGVTSRGMAEGGQQEYDLANQYATWSEAVQASHPRTAAALRDLADSYRAEGQRNDEEARRFLEGMDF
ncbi:hypothetical protein [Nocardia cyriacigeorgica]|uniref:hypothetical protein n=1 Tax=Nocardia cyriacigeorgica TaxID=135487 RepID=UPI001893F384|nr:hypothetical protein [Nocardia cyriacigeorgica]MBF6412008.1 hypothetical protein [Nocardia cyriacigeorgica]